MLNVREAAARVSRTAETVRRWVWSGRLPARRDGNRLLLAIEDLDRLAVGAGRGSGDLTDWLAQVTAQPRPQARSGRSAADLVLTERAERRCGH